MGNELWPDGGRFDEQGELWLGGCAAGELAAQYGTPLYVFDEGTLRGRARAYRAALATHYPGESTAAYAAKAYLCTALARLWNEEGLDLDVVSGGELAVALAAGFPAGRIHFHGNNKSQAELEQALDAGVGRIVVDNFTELELLAGLTAGRAGIPVGIWLRLAPGIQPHTHAHIQTGQRDTKFGFPLGGGGDDAEAAVRRALAAPGLALVGLHAHIGSQIYDPAPLAAAAERLAGFAGEMRARYGWQMAELSPGGGWGVPMVPGDADAPVAPYVAGLSAALVAACEGAGLPLPRLVLEPGRSLLARAGVALYRVGSRKQIAGVRTYVAVDGGMADNIRPALYGAAYTASLVGIPAGTRPDETVTIAGKFCESGDILIRDIALPAPRPGDLLAIPMAGAYTLAMASNYNLALRPAVVLVQGGAARLIQRRETDADLTARDVDQAPAAGYTPAPSSASGIPAGARRLRFRKYHGLGNDYLVLDPATAPEPPAAELVVRMCDRHRGPGADGVLWGPAQADEPFALRIYNPDGSEAGVSGNGVRIFAADLWRRGLPARRDFAIHTPVTTVTAHVLDEHARLIALDLGLVTFDSARVPVAGPRREVVEERLEVDGSAYSITAASVGNPHCVLFCEEVSPELAHRLGPAIERLPLFPERTNVQFAQVLDSHTLRIEIWERGAGYTLASGSSSCAAAAAAVRTGRCASPVTVRMPGGELQVEIDAEMRVRLTGPVEAVYEGEVID